MAAGATDDLKVRVEGLGGRYVDLVYGAAVRQMGARVRADQWITRGNEAIMMLQPRASKEGKAAGYQNLGTMYDAQPKYPLDDSEEKIVKAIEQGDFLEPEPRVGDVFAPMLTEAQAIVRAKLTGVAEDSSTWKVVRTLKGNVETQYVVLGNEMFHARAEAVVNEEQTKGNSRKDVGTHADRVKEVVKAMVEKELTKDKEAILFLGDCKVAEGKTRAVLQHRAYGEKLHPTLDELEEAIGDPKSKHNQIGF